MKKQYRISHTEEKVIELMRDDNSVKSILKICDSDNSILKCFIDYYLGTRDFTDYSLYSRWGDNLSVIKRLSESEYKAILYLRVVKAKKLSLFRGIDYKQFSDIPACVKLYNLTSKGVSKTLDTLLDTGFLSEEQLSTISEIIGNTQNSLFIVGDLNTGKITLLNALLYKLSTESIKIAIFDKLSELQLDFIDDKSSIKRFDIENMTLKDISELNDYVFVTTDASSKYFSMIRKLCNYSRIFGILPVSTLDDVNRDEDIYLEIYDSLIALTGIKEDKKCLMEVELYD